MTTTKEKVLELVASGKVTAAEGDELLKALGPPGVSRWRKLVNPFEAMPLSLGLALGVAGVLAALALTTLKVHFDGALDVHFGADAPVLAQALLEQAVVWPGVALVLWACAWALARQSRFVDFLSVVAVARLPLIVTGLAVGFLGPYLPTAVGAEPSQVAVAPLLLLVVVTLPAIVISFTWFYQGFRNASGLRGVKAAVAFTLSIIAAEILSKTALWALS